MQPPPVTAHLGSAPPAASAPSVGGDLGARGFLGLAAIHQQVADLCIAALAHFNKNYDAPPKKQILILSWRIAESTDELQVNCMYYSLLQTPK
jgi:hypothetical protein